MRTIALLAAIGAASAFAPAGVLPSRFLPALPRVLDFTLQYMHHCKSKPGQMSPGTWDWAATGTRAEK